MDIKKYNEALTGLLKEAEDKIPLKQLGLSIQKLFAVKDGNVSTNLFIVGKHIFKEVDLDVLEEERWQEAKIAPNGTVYMPSSDHDDRTFHKKYYCIHPAAANEGWDFSKNPVLENILFAVNHFHAADAGIDLVAYKNSRGEDLFYLPKDLLVKLLGPESMPEMILTDDLSAFCETGEKEEKCRN